MLNEVLKEIRGYVQKDQATYTSFVLIYTVLVSFLLAVYMQNYLGAIFGFLIIILMVNSFTAYRAIKGWKK